MAIQITNADAQPALVYNNWFLDKLSLEQRSESNNNSIPYYTLKINYRLFAVDDTGKRHFKTKVHTLIIDDYIKVATEKAQSGDTDLIVTMHAIENALATIVEDQTNLGNASVI